jgi:DNA-binding NtrC family response regulator
MRILIVDDERSLLLTLAANLELEGFEVACANGGGHALELLAQQPFDLVLTDVRMPQMDGLELFRRIRAVNAQIPVLLMTAFAMEDLIEQAITEGVFAVLPKPFEIDHAINALVRASRRPTVLLLDHEEGAQAIASAVSAMGIACRVLTDPSDALSAVRDHRVDVCVVNLASSAPDGAELVERLIDADGSVAVIAVAAQSVAALLRRAADLGAFACLGKPFQPLDLVHVVANARAHWQPPRRHADAEPR